MRYVEYIYLASMIMIGIFLWLERAILSLSTQWILSIAALSCLVMYFFRNRQRKSRDKKRAEEISAIQEELNE